MILGIDLAARYSAAVLLDEGGQVTHQFDSWDVTTFGFCAHVAQYANGSHMKAVIVEDLPYGINSQFMVKAPLRLQGVLAHALGPALAYTHFVMPSTWQRAMGVWKASPMDTEAVSREAGYEPPDTVSMYGPKHLNAKGKLLAVDRKKLEKVRTDYVDAYLIAEWARRTLAGNVLAGSGIQQFTI